MSTIIQTVSQGNGNDLTNTRYVTTALNAYSPAGYIQSDGATANRAQIYGPFDSVNNPREWVAGAASLTIAAVLTVPTSNPSSVCYVFLYGKDNPITGIMDGTIELAIYTDGSMQLAATADGNRSNNRYATWSGFISAYAGKTVLFKVYFVNGTTNPVITINGVDVSSNFGPYTVTGTGCSWLNSTQLTPTYRLVGYNWPSGPAPIVTPILGVTSAADDLFYMSTGKWPFWIASGGSAASLVTGNDSTFSGATSVWNSFTGSTLTVSAGTLVCTNSGSVSAQVNGLNLELGKAYRLKYTLVAGAVTSVAVAGSNQGLDNNSVLGAKTIDFVNSVSSSGAIYFLNATTFTLDNVTVSPLGALSIPLIQNCKALGDSSSIGGNTGTLLGMTPVCASKDWLITYDTYNTNQLIGLGDVIDSTRDVIDYMEQSTTGTPSTTIGSASAGAQYRVSGALAAGINPVTLVTCKAASNQFWIGSSTSGVKIRTTIKGHTTN